MGDRYSPIGTTLTHDTMEEIIKAYLDQYAKDNPDWAVKYTAQDGHNIKDCCAYINSEARKQQEHGTAMVADQVVYGWAVHYYDEPVEATKPAVKSAPKAKVAAPATPDLFSAVKTTAKKTEKKPNGTLPVFEAVKPIEQPKTEPKKNYTQLSLFDF